MSLGMDRLDIRVKNALRKGSFTATSQLLEHSVGLAETLRKVEPHWRARKRKAIAGALDWGACFTAAATRAHRNPSGCHIRLTEDGRIALHVGACEIGQGPDTGPHADHDGDPRGRRARGETREGRYGYVTGCRFVFPRADRHISRAGLSMRPLRRRGHTSKNQDTTRAQPP